MQKVEPCAGGGAPGTGRTTMAQWLAHAWNAGADRVPAEAVATLLAPNERGDGRILE